MILLLWLAVLITPVRLQYSLNFIDSTPNSCKKPVNCTSTNNVTFMGTILPYNSTTYDLLPYQGDVQAMIMVNFVKILCFVKIDSSFLSAIIIVNNGIFRKNCQFYKPYSTSLNVGQWCNHFCAHYSCQNVAITLWNCLPMTDADWCTVIVKLLSILLYGQVL